MNVLVLTREFPPNVLGGLSYHLAHLYGEIVETGHGVTVVAGLASDARSAAAELVHDDIALHTVTYGRATGSQLKAPIAIVRFLRTVDLSEFDVAVAHTPFPFTLPIPVVEKYHDCPQEERQYFRQDLNAVGRIADSVLNPVRRLIEGRSLSIARHAVFNSNLCRQTWEKHYNIQTPSTVIYNGVDTMLFAPREVDSPRLTPPIDTEEYVLFVGDDERKGLSRIRRFSHRSKFTVVVVGTRARIPGARTLGYVSPGRLAELYSGAVATLHPAKFEAFGNVVLESLACGTPVVTSERCGAGELLTDDCGAVTANLSAGIAHCRQLDSRNCVDLAREYSWKRTASRTMTLLAELQ